MNKKSIFKHILLLCLLFCLQKGQAQTTDKMYMRDGLIISVKIMSTKGDSVFYRANFASFQKILFGVPKTRIDKIVYQGEEMEFYGGKVINYAQRDKKQKSDMIYKKDNSELAVNIVSTEGDSVQYRAYFNNTSNFVFRISKSEVDRVIYKNGLIEDMSEQSAENSRLASENLRIFKQQKEHVRDSIEARLGKHKNIIKFSPFTIAVNYTVLSYERLLAKGQSAELKVGIIGVQQDKYDLPANGAFGSISYKLIVKSAERPKKPRNPLHGLYFRPEFAWGSYKQIYKHETFRGSNKTPETVEAKHQVSYGCFVVNVGKQWVSEPLVFDLFFGGGLGSYSQSAESFGVVNRTRYSYRMDMDSVKGSANVKFKMGLYIGFVF